MHDGRARERTRMFNFMRNVDPFSIWMPMVFVSLWGILLYEVFLT